MFSALTVFDAFVTLSAILLSIKSPVASVVFGFALFEAAFVVFAVDFLALLRDFWLYLLFRFLPIFFAKDKNP